jgi:HK97 gp10 family phage protein
MANGLEIDGFDDLASRAEALQEAFGTAAERVDSGGPTDRATERTARRISTTASINAPKESGRLVNSIHVEKQADGVWLVVVGVDYGADVEYGTAAEYIYPDEADALRFEVDGEIVFAARVEAAPAQPYLRPAIEEHRQEFPEEVVSEIRSVIDEELAAVGVDI